MEISHERYVTTFNSLPEVIRSYIVDGKVAPIVSDIGKKYSLHIDIVGQLEKKTTFMLMGLISPAELLGELMLAGIDSPSGKAILDELNTRIFTPLRKDMQAAAHAEITEAPALTQAQTSQSKPASVPQIAPAPPVSSPPISVPQSSAITPPPPILVTPQQPLDISAYTRTMAGDMARVSHGLQGQPATPARSFQTASVPITQTMPVRPIAPATISEPAHALESAYPPPKTAPVRLTPVDREYAHAPITKEYGNDPYREPID